jgi:predicted nucleic acid-binding Zn ribbon protein
MVIDVHDRDPQNLKALLPTLLARLTREGRPAALLGPVWSELAGAQLAEHSHPTALSGDCLHVQAESSLWAGVLEVHTPELLARLEKNHPRLGIRRLEISLP